MEWIYKLSFETGKTLARLSNATNSVSETKTCRERQKLSARTEQQPVPDYGDFNSDYRVLENGTRPGSSDQTRYTELAEFKKSYSVPLNLFTPLNKDSIIFVVFFKNDSESDRVLLARCLNSMVNQSVSPDHILVFLYDSASDEVDFEKLFRDILLRNKENISGSDFFENPDSADGQRSVLRTAQHTYSEPAMSNAHGALDDIYRVSNNPWLDIDEYKICCIKSLYKENISFVKNTAVLWISSIYEIHQCIHKQIQVNFINYRCAADKDWNMSLFLKLHTHRQGIVVGGIQMTDHFIQKMIRFYNSRFLNFFLRENNLHRTCFFSENCSFYLHQINNYVWWNTKIKNEFVSDIYFTKVLESNDIGIPLIFEKEAKVYYHFSFVNSFLSNYFFNIGRNYWHIRDFIQNIL